MPPQIISGPPNYITLSNIIVGNDATNVYVRCDTDQACQIRYRMWREKDPSVVYTETESAAATGKRYQTLARSTLAGGADISGDIVFVELSTPVPPNAATGPLMRPYVGQCRVTGARTTTNGKAVPVRWNTFGDGTRPPNGGGTTNLGQGPAAGNWSSYTWTQYNPKQSTFPAP